MTPAARPRLRSISGRKSSERVMVEPRHVKEQKNSTLYQWLNRREGDLGKRQCTLLSFLAS